MKKIEFSKKLAILIIAFFFLLVIFSLLTWFFQNRIPTTILETVSTPFMVVVTSYFIKSGYENGKKIERSNNEQI